MSKAAKIAITIGLMVVWALLRSLLEYSDFPLPVLTFVFILIILGIWAFGKTPKAPEDERPINRVDSEKQSDVGGIVFSDEKERKDPLPHIQVKSESETEIAKHISPQIGPSNMNIDILNKDYVISLLKEKCHPRHFMKPYDYEKVNIANRLYSSLNENCSLEDLKDIISEATEKLQVTIDTSQVVAELCKACSPEKFMDPYDAEKIGRANELYSKILANKSNIIELLILKKDALNQGLFFLPEPKEKATTTKTPDLGRPSVIAPIKQDKPKIPNNIVNYWKSKTGSWVRLAKYVDNGLFYLETKSGDSWKVIATLVKTKGDELNGGFGSEYVDSSSRMITYRIHLWSGKLIKSISKEVSDEWKFDVYPYAVQDLVAANSKMTEEEKEKDEMTRNYYNYGSD